MSGPAIADVTARTVVAPLVERQPVVHTARQERFERQFRLLVVQRLRGMVVSTLDIALWDVLGIAVGQSVARLLGGDAGVRAPSASIAAPRSWHHTALPGRPEWASPAARRSEARLGISRRR